MATINPELDLDEITDLLSGTVNRISPEMRGVIAAAGFYALGHDLDKLTEERTKACLIAEKTAPSE